MICFVSKQSTLKQVNQIEKDPHFRGTHQHLKRQQLLTAELPSPAPMMCTARHLDFLGGQNVWAEFEAEAEASWHPGIGQSPDEFSDFFGGMQ